MNCAVCTTAYPRYLVKGRRTWYRVCRHCVIDGCLNIDIQHGPDNQRDVVPFTLPWISTIEPRNVAPL